MPRRLPLIAALAGLAVIAAALAVVLTQQRVPMIGTNNEFVGGPTFAIDPGKEVCQPRETVPAGTGAVSLGAAAGDKPNALRARIRKDGQVLASGVTRWDGKAKGVTIALDRTLEDEVAGAATCFEVAGTMPAQFWAFGRSGDISAYTGDFRFDARMRLEYLAPGAESRAAHAGDTIRRVATARASLLDGWAPWGALVAVLGVLGVLLVAVKRELTP